MEGNKEKEMEKRLLELEMKYSNLIEKSGDRQHYSSSSNKSSESKSRSRSRSPRNRRDRPRTRSRSYSHTRSYRRSETRSHSRSSRRGYGYDPSQFYSRSRSPRRTHDRSQTLSRSRSRHRSRRHSGSNSRLRSYADYHQDEYIIGPRYYDRQKVGETSNRSKQGNDCRGKEDRINKSEELIVSPPKNDKRLETNNGSQQNVNKEDLDIFGERLFPDRDFAPAVHDHLAAVWNDILNKGLPGDEKKKLLKVFTPPKNCSRMDPSKLNLEVKSAVDTSIQKRDERIVEKQEKISASLAGISKTIDLIFKMNIPEKKEILENRNIIMRILADLQHDGTVIRRCLILKNIAAPLKETLKDLPFDNLLFSKDLSDQIKAAKAMRLSSKDLKLPSKNSGDKKDNSKNFKSPFSRSQPRKKYYQRGNGQKYTRNQNQRPAYRGKSSNWNHNQANSRKND